MQLVVISHNKSSLIGHKSLKKKAFHVSHSWNIHIHIFLFVFQFSLLLYDIDNTQQCYIRQVISGFHRAFLKSITFIGRLMHLIV